MAKLNILNLANAAPPQATYIGVRNTAGELVGKIPLGHLEKTNRGQLLYKIGLMSDIHVDSGDFNYSGGSSTTYWVGDEGEADLKRALKYFKDDLGCAFVCSAGDIGLSSTSDEYTIYTSCLAEAAPDLPVYITTGNHDVYSSTYYGNSAWNGYTRRSIETSAHTLTNSTAYQNSFYFTHTSTGLDGSTINDRYVFFSMYQNTPGSSGSPYLAADITWLSNLLNSFDSNDRVLIFTHYYFPDYAGNLGRVDGVGGMYGYEKGLAGTQETTLVNLMKAHPNTIWFSGHTHWSWQMQEYESKANIMQDTSGAWTVHLSSLSSPIDCTTYQAKGSNTSSINQYGRRAGSQGAYAAIYENGIEIYCIDFNTEAHLNDDGTQQGDTSTDHTAIIPYCVYWMPSNDAGGSSGTGGGDSGGGEVTPDPDTPAETLNWIHGSGISSSTGTTSTTTYRSITDFIAFDSTKHYFLSATNLLATDSSDTAGSINSIAMYAYDADQNYLGRIVGFGKDISDTYDTWYFDQAGGAGTTEFTDVEITEKLADNSGSVTNAYTGTMAYFRISIQATTGDASSATQTDHITLKITDGSGGGGSTTTETWNITKTLTNCEISNSATTVEKNGSYNATITRDTTAYPNLAITVTMGGTDISATAVTDNVINITSVTGNVVITAVASAAAAPTTNLNWTLSKKLSSSTGAESDDTSRAVSDYISVTSGNSYYLSANNIIAQDSSDTTNGINSIAMYAYDSSKSYLGRVPGAGYEISNSYNSWYFDQIGGSGTSSFSDVDITNYIFDNDGSTSDGASSYTGTIAYVRISIIAANSTITDNHTAQVTLREVTGGGGGGGETPVTPTTYSITNTLTNCSNSNNITSIEENSAYNTTISYDTSVYDTITITVTMSDTDISATAVSGTSISIAAVTGNIVITAAASKTAAPAGYTTATVKSYSDFANMSTGDSKVCLILNPSSTGYMLGYDGSAISNVAMSTISSSLSSAGTSISTAQAETNLGYVTTGVQAYVNESKYQWKITKTASGYTIETVDGGVQFYTTSSAASVTFGSTGTWQIQDGSSNAGSSNYVYGRSEQCWINNGSNGYLNSGGSTNNDLCTKTTTGGWTMWLLYELS